MNCPFCKEAVANEGDLQLHYLYCPAYAETRPPGDLEQRTTAVRFRWVKTRPCIEQEVHLISSLAGSVTLRWAEAGGLFESEQANVPVGHHVCQLAVSGDVLPTKDFVVGEESDVIDIILAQGNLLGDVARSVLRDTSPVGVGNSPLDWLDTGVVSPIHERRQDLTLDIDSDRSEEHNPHDLSPLHKELIRHQVIHGEPSWVPRGGRQSPFLFEEEGGVRPSHPTAPDPPLLTTRPAYLDELRSRSPVPLRHGVEVTPTTHTGQGEVESTDGRSEQDDIPASRSASSSHSAAGSAHSSARLSPVNSDADANEGSARSPFSEEELLPQSRESPEVPPEGQDMEPKGATFAVEVVGVRRVPGGRPPGQEETGDPRPESHRSEGDLSTDVTRENGTGSPQSSSRASPLGSVLDNTAPGTGTSTTAGAGGSVLTEPPPERTSPTGSALSDSGRLPGGRSPLTSPRTRSLSDINRSSHRLSPSTSLRSEPQFPLPPHQLERLLCRTEGWRTTEGSPHGGHSGGSLPDTDRTTTEGLSHRSHRESPPGGFLTGSPRLSRSDVSSEGSKHSSRQGTPPIDDEARPSSAQRSTASRHSSRASSIHAEPGGATGIPAAVVNGRGSGDVASPHSSTHASPKRTPDSHHPPESDTSRDVGVDDVSRESRDRPASGYRRSPRLRSPAEVLTSGGNHSPLRDSRRSEEGRAETTRSGSRTSSEGRSSREDTARMGPAGERSYGSSRSSSAQSEEVASLLEILRRNEGKESTFKKKAEHQTPSPQARAPLSPGLNRGHEGRASETALARGVPFIPSRATAFEVVSGERGPPAADVEALTRERDGLAQELKIRTAHFEQELRRLKMTNEDLEQQLLSVQMVANLSQESEKKRRETERSLEALKNARAAELGRLEEQEAEIKRLKERDEESARRREKIAQLEKENRLLNEEHESLRTVQQIRMEDFDKARADLELELSALRRSLRSSSQRDREEMTRLRESNSTLRKKVSSLELENEDLKRKLDRAKNKPANTEYRMSRAKSETDLSAKRNKNYDDHHRPAGSVNSLRTGSSGFGSTPSAWLEPSDDMLYRKYIGRSSSLTNGDYAVGRSTSPYERTYDPLGAVSRRRFGSMVDESEFSDVSDLDHGVTSRRRTMSSESSMSSLFSGMDRDPGTNGYSPTTNGYRTSRVYSPEDYGHAPPKRRGQRPHSFHGDVSVLGDKYRAMTSESLRHTRPVTSGYTPKILDSNPSRETSRLARYGIASTRSHVTEPLPDNKPYAPSSAQDVRVGSRVLVTRTRGKIGRGVVKYVGLLPGRTDTYVGVELEQADGKHDGSLDGQRFFRCKPNYGIFVSFNKVVMCYG